MIEQLTLDLSPKKHSGKIETSARLQETLAMLPLNKWVSAFKIAMVTNSLAVHSDISDLRDNGFVIDQGYGGLSENNRRISEYRRVK